MIKLCKCGCGEAIVIKPSHKYYGIPDFIKGHSSRMPGHFMPTHNVKHTEESKKKMSDAKKLLVGELSPMFGKKHSEETKKKISKSRIGRFCGEDGSFWGKHHSDETKERMSLNMKGRYDGNDNPFYGKKHSPETIRKMSKLATKRNASPERRNEISEWTKKGMTPEVSKHLSEVRKGRKMGEDHKRKISETLQERFKDPEYACKMGKAWNLKPNKPEKRILNLLNKMYPGEWKYTGDFSFMINGKNPDFVNCNGQKKIIEMFGDYWHKGENPQDRIDTFNPFGYDTLIIWEHELKNIDQLKRKLGGFCK